MGLGFRAREVQGKGSCSVRSFSRQKGSEDFSVSDHVCEQHDSMLVPQTGLPTHWCRGHRALEHPGATIARRGRPVPLCSKDQRRLRTHRMSFASSVQCQKWCLPRQRQLSLLTPSHLKKTPCLAHAMQTRRDVPTSRDPTLPSARWMCSRSMHRCEDMVAWPSQGFGDWSPSCSPSFLPRLPHTPRNENHDLTRP